jgi:hypothetical protein
MEASAAKVGLSHIGISAVGVSERSTCKVSLLEISSYECGRNKIARINRGSRQAGATQVCVLELDMSQASAREITTPQRRTIKGCTD